VTPDSWVAVLLVAGSRVEVCRAALRSRNWSHGPFNVTVSRNLKITVESGLLWHSLRAVHFENLILWKPITFWHMQVQTNEIFHTVSQCLYMVITHSCTNITSDNSQHMSIFHTNNRKFFQDTYTKLFDWYLRHKTTLSVTNRDVRGRRGSSSMVSRRGPSLGSVVAAVAVTIRGGWGLATVVH
jgi:hypothetical protein